MYCIVYIVLDLFWWSTLFTSMSTSFQPHSSKLTLFPRILCLLVIFLSQYNPPLNSLFLLPSLVPCEPDCGLDTLSLYNLSNWSDWELENQVTLRSFERSITITIFLSASHFPLPVWPVPSVTPHTRPSHNYFSFFYPTHTILPLSSQPLSSNSLPHTEPSPSFLSLPVIFSHSDTS